MTTTNKYAAIIAITATAVVGIVGCKPTEQNYRQAYEKAMEGRRSNDFAEDSTIYTKMRRQEVVRTEYSANGDSISVRTRNVSITPNEKGDQVIPEKLKRYCVVAGQFKQVFNARSMRTRLEEAGFAGAMILQTAEPYYYVVAASVSDFEQAVAEIKRLQKIGSITLKSPAPFILEPSQLAR